MFMKKWNIGSDIRCRFVEGSGEWEGRRPLADMLKLICGVRGLILLINSIEIGCCLPRVSMSSLRYI